jgi:hypothetical protein
LLFLLGFAAGLAAAGWAALSRPVEVHLVQRVGQDFHAEVRAFAAHWQGSGRPLHVPPPAPRRAHPGSAPASPTRALALFRRLLAAARAGGRVDTVRLALVGGVGDAFATALFSGATVALLTGLAAANGHRPEVRYRPSFTAARLEVTVEATYRARPAAVVRALWRGLKPAGRARR